MGFLLPFSPFIAFALVEKVAGVVPGLIAGALLSVALLIRDRRRGERDLNILEAGSALLFVALAVMLLAGGRGAADGWSLWQVRLWVDGGLLALVLASIALRRPFTLQHARRQVSPETAASAAFLRTNIILSGAWALAFAALVGADLLMVRDPQAPLALAIGITLAALAGAAGFTVWFAARVSARASRAR